MDEQQQRYLQVFIEEAENHLEEASEILSAPDPPGPDAIATLFRLFHTLKSMAASMQQQALAELFHALEDRLNEAQQQGALAERDRQLALESLEVANRHIDAMAEGEEAVVAIAETTAQWVQRLQQDFAKKDSGTLTLRLLIDEAPPLRGARAFLALRALQEASITLLGEDPPRAQLAQLTPETLSVRLPADQLEKAQAALAQVPGIRIEEVGAETASSSATPPFKAAPPKRVAGRRDRGIRIEAATLDQLLDRSSESLLLVTQLEHLLRENRTVASFLSRLRVLVSDINRIIESYRLIPLRSLLANASQVVAETATTLGKEVTLDLDVGSAALDRTAAAALSEPLLHLLRNAVDHGIEMPQQRLAQGKPRQGQVRVQARTDGQRVLLTVEDDGAGIDWERVRQKGVEKGLLSPAAAEQLDEQALTALLFQPGFSTNEQVTEISGRGVGLDVVQTAVEGQGGRIQVESTQGKGTRFLLYLPVRLTVLEALLVQSNGATFAIALQQVQRCVEVLPEQLVAQGGALYWQEGEQLLPYLSLTAWSQRQPSRRPQEPQAGVVLSLEGQPLLLGVDALLEEREIVIKPLGGLFSQTAGIRGATILPDGSAAIILDIEGLLALQEKGA